MYYIYLSNFDLETSIDSRQEPQNIEREKTHTLPIIVTTFVTMTTMLKLGLSCSSAGVYS